MRHLRPGDDGFTELAAQITPIQRVRRELFPKTAFYEDRVPYVGGRRRETIEKI